MWFSKNNSTEVVASRSEFKLISKLQSGSFEVLQAKPH